MMRQDDHGLAKLLAAVALGVVGLLPACDNNAATTTPDVVDGSDATDSVDVAAEADAGPPAGEPCPAGASRGAEGYCLPDAPLPSAALDECSWPELPADALHVDAAAGDGGDGSEAAPYATLAAGLAAAAAGDTVALHPGSYEGGVDVPAGVAVIGRCADEVTITGAADAVALRLDAVAAVHLEGFSVRGALVGIQAIEATDLRIRRVRVAETRRGMDFQAGTALVEACRVEDTIADVPETGKLPTGRGITAFQQSTLVLASTVVIGSGRSGLSLTETEITITAGCRFEENGQTNAMLQTNTYGLVEDAVLRAAHGGPAGYAYGVIVLAAGDLLLRNSEISDNPDAGVAVEGGGPTTIEGNTIAGGGRGINVQETAVEVTIRANVLESNRRAGVRVLNAAARIEDNTIRDVTHDPGSPFADAIHLDGADDVVVTGNTIEAPARTGVLASGASRATVAGNTITQAAWPGVLAQGGSQLVVDDNQVTACTIYGVAVITGSEASVTANTIEGVAAGPEGAADGILVSSGAAARIEDNVLIPMPTGLMPSPLRVGILVDDPAVPTAEGAGLPAGVAAVIADNTVAEAEYGIVLQGVAGAELVSVDTNDLGGATEAQAADLGLPVLGASAPADNVSIPMPTGL